MLSGTTLAIGLAISTAIMWGFTPILDRRGLEAGGTTLQAATTVVAVDTTLYWIALLALTGGVPFGELTWETFLLFAAAGVLGTAIGRLAIFAGIRRVGASITSAAISSRPLFATVLAVTWLGEPLGETTGIGIVVLVGGLVLLSISKGGDVSGWRPRDVLYPIVAAAAFGIANVARRYGLLESPISTLEAVTINETAAAVSLFAIAAVVGGRDVWNASKESYAYFAASGAVTTVALFAFFAAFALEDGRIAIVDSLQATAPLFTTLFAAVLLKKSERITRGVVAGASLIVIGAVLIAL